MNTILAHRHSIKQNFILLIGLCLCVYFSYHLLQGHRSYPKLMQLNSKIETMSLKHSKIEGERQKLETKVVMMRPNSLDRDLLEERVRLVLGYAHKDEFTISYN